MSAIWLTVFDKKTVFDMDQVMFLTPLKALENKRIFS